MSVRFRSPGVDKDDWLAGACLGAVTNNYGLRGTKKGLNLRWKLGNLSAKLNIH